MCDIQKYVMSVMSDIAAYLVKCAPSMSAHSEVFKAQSGDNVPRLKAGTYF